MDKKMNRKEFCDYIHRNFAVSGEFSRLLDNVLQFIEENCPSERQHDVLLSLLDGTIGLSDEEILKVHLTGKDKEEKTQQSITVKTELGNLTAYPSTDPAHPGIYIDLKRDGECGAPIAMTEFSCDEADLEEGAAHIITRVWNNCAKEDYSTRVVHKGIEEYFSADSKAPN